VACATISVRELPDASQCSVAALRYLGVVSRLLVRARGHARLNGVPRRPTARLGTAVTYFAAVIRLCSVMVADPQILVNSANFGFAVTSGRYPWRAWTSATGSAAHT